MWVKFGELTPDLSRTSIRKSFDISVSRIKSTKNERKKSFVFLNWKFLSVDFPLPEAVAFQNQSVQTLVTLKQIFQHIWLGKKWNDLEPVILPQPLDAIVLLMQALQLLK